MTLNFALKINVINRKLHVMITKKPVFIVELIQRVEKAGKERRRKRPVNPTHRDPVKEVKTLMNIEENEKELTEALAMNEV